MKKIIVLGFFLFISFYNIAQARVDTVDLFTDALLTSDISELEKTLAPNFWYIGANGHIRDKDHFIEEMKEGKLKIDRISFTNLRETAVGNTRLLTANGNFHGRATMPLPEGLMRYTIVLANNNGKEQIALLQATPVIATKECSDGNCLIK